MSRALGRLARAVRRSLCVPTVSTLQHARSWADAASGPSPSESYSPAYVFHSHFRVAAYCVAAQSLAQDHGTYRISVVTGNVRGAGTPSMAWVQLVGTNGESEKFIVGNSGEEGLLRGSRVTFDVHLTREIGALRRVYIQREKGSITDTGDGWYLDAVEVQGPQGEHYSFPCHSWFGQSDCGDYIGPMERNLIPVKEERALAPHEIVAAPVEISAAGVAFPHPDKVLKNKIRGVNMRGFGYGGEDAYFYCHGKNNIFGMGVADGVYMWKELGIDSGTMSRTLMETCLHMVQAGYEDVFKVLSIAARHVESEGVQGSCTACVVTINKAVGRLHCANLGDSGFLLVGPRAGSEELVVKFRTAQLEHEFGCPFQLGHHRSANSPDDADLATFPVARGDVVVMGSDGLLDNLSDQEVLDEVNRAKAAGLRAPQAAQALAKAAFDASVDTRRVTPYSLGATEAFDMVYTGGKRDDITVLVAYVA